MSTEEPERKPVTVNKEIPVNYDLGLLSVNDPQPLDHIKLSDSKQREDYIKDITRDNVQLLINQILSLPLQKKENITLVTLPDPIFKLPREKSIPKPRELTRWEKFAAKKGIQKKGKEGKLVYDEESKEWVNKWGYKGNNKKIDNQWAVEVEDKSDNKKVDDSELLDPRKLHRDERKKLIKKNLLQQKRNREQ
ncbi:Rhodanese- sulfurtransferase [Pichia californica]|uniref:Ribosome biogenesis regulatory protein n=1 Tax=Pichia californica TaxID=460514 RepID=A0A9P6WQG5_9ASCO|nr:Rhodanese- sulfurtransferase [[Candida] californica]